MFHPADEKLTKAKRCVVKIMSVVLAVVKLGLFHLIARVALYNRNFKQKNPGSEPAINIIRQTILPAIQQIQLTIPKPTPLVVSTPMPTAIQAPQPSVGGVITPQVLPTPTVAKPIVQPLPPAKNVLNDPLVLQKCNPAKSLQDVIYDWNVKQMAEWEMLQTKDERIKLLKDRKQNYRQ